MEISMKELGDIIANNNQSSERNPLSDYYGKSVFIRTVTHHYTGRVSELIGTQAVRLSDAAWIADDGLFSSALAKGELNEVEPYIDDVIVFIGSMIDVTEWRHKLPRERK